jgi:putative Holliday junction resolvase
VAAYYLKMSKVLGIDYGKKKIGLASATTTLAEVYGVIRFETIKEAIRKIRKTVEREKVEKIVIGISEGKMAKETKRFGRKLEKEINLPVVFQDETLSTKEAQALAIEAGIRRKKRKQLEDAYAAAVILQDYLDLRGKL